MADVNFKLTSNIKHFSLPKEKKTNLNQPQQGLLFCFYILLQLIIKSSRKMKKISHNLWMLGDRIILIMYS